MAGPQEYNRRTFILAGVVMIVLLGLGALASGFLIDSNDEPMGDTNPAVIVDEQTGDTAPVERGDGRPDIVPRPNSGKAPETPGDPGGSQQLLLLGGVMVAMAGIGVWVFTGGRRARANKAAWRAAAEPGQEERRREVGRRTPVG